MKNLLISVLVFFSFLLFAQKPTINTAPRGNYFQSKVDTSKKSVLKPNTKAVRKIKDKSIFHKKGDAFFIEPQINTSSNLRTLGGSADIVVDYLKNTFQLNDDFSFEKTSEKTDDLGFKHYSYKQLFKGIYLNESVILVHSKNEEIKFINGHIADSIELNITPAISEAEAISAAKKELNVTNLINENPSQLVITKTGNEYQLAYKVRIDAINPVIKFNVFVNAKNGNVVKKYSLIAHDDEVGTADTYYSGSQTLTTDKFDGGYRLLDNGRKIATRVASGDSFIDYVNDDNTWEGIPFVTTFTISNTDQSWWYSFFADSKPDFYLKLRDGDNNIVYTTAYKKNTDSPVTFELNQYLLNPPYLIEIWDKDNSSSDDFGGSYTISTSNGAHTWSGSGNNGSYEVQSIGNPALDVHWGTQKSYDFYLNILGRNSFDDNGGVTFNFVNGCVNFGKEPTNAFAIPSLEENLLVFGRGDGITFNPVVGLDIVGHEFTHLVVEHNGNGGLPYAGESGALNESFADIMGTAIEFYSGVDPDWTIAEGIIIKPPFVLRSMSNPKIAGDPDTYEGESWINPSDLQKNHGGVHTNSGVQNHWFYLLSEGGLGTNDLGNSYSVTSIGITDAIKIAYRNLVTYLTPSATYYDAYEGSLKSAEDLFGNPSIQHTAVREAWYAVGIGNDPNKFCSGTTELTETSGSFSDGSGSADYGNNANCKWVISPPGAQQITLNFTSFDTENNYDTVYVYDGPDETHPLLMSWYGNTLPPTINTTYEVGAMCIVFKSDNLVTAGGWSAVYSSTSITPTCSGGTNHTAQSGSLDDGSGNNNYTNNQECFWMIAPPCAETITLNFTAFDTEENYDGLIILDGFGYDANIIDVLTGTTLPNSVVSTTGEMLIIFQSDYATTRGGFEATYTSTGYPYCSGLTNMNTTDHGYLEDGSDTSNYCNNMDCQWLIQPPQATSITLEFIDFEIESASSDGKSIYDVLEIYDGSDTSATLLGQFTGSSIPTNVTSSGGAMLVRFKTDMGGTFKGWSAFYSSSHPSYCNETDTLTTYTGIIKDGSEGDSYANNTYCSWLIQPENSESVTLSFQEFETEKDYDGVVVYDGANNSASILGEFSGSSLPSSLTSSGGSMFIEFLSDEALRSSGFEATYNTLVTGTNSINIPDYLNVYPNPNEGTFYINNLQNQPLNIQIFDIQGKEVYSKQNLVTGTTKLNFDNLIKGIYTLKAQNSDEVKTIKITIK